MRASTLHFMHCAKQKKSITLHHVIRNQKIMLQRQNKLQDTLESLTSYFYEYLDRQYSENYAANTNPSSNLRSADSIAALPFEPIESIEKLTQFEERLKDENYLNQVVESMSFVCGKSGKSMGLDCCYKLIDYFMTRDFVTQCSWTGNTRLGPGVEKVPLKFFENFRKCFRSIITLADSKFTETENEDFFKRIMKNSMQRQKSGTQRQSKHKNRPKNLKYNNIRSWRQDDENSSSNAKVFDEITEMETETNELKDTYIKIDLESDSEMTTNETYASQRKQKQVNE